MNTMKKFMNKVFAMAAALAVKASAKTEEARKRFNAIISQKSGEGFVDTALKILISVVIGALLLAGLYMLFNDTVIPTLVDKVKELFDYKG